jgi:hypothetical protein
MILGLLVGLALGAFITGVIVFAFIFYLGYKMWNNS